MADRRSGIEILFIRQTVIFQALRVPPPTVSLPPAPCSFLPMDRASFRPLLRPLLSGMQTVRGPPRIPIACVQALRRETTRKHTCFSILRVPSNLHPSDAPSTYLHGSGRGNAQGRGDGRSPGVGICCRTPDAFVVPFFCFFFAVNDNFDKHADPYRCPDDDNQGIPSPHEQRAHTRPTTVPCPRPLVTIGATLHRTKIR